MDLNLEEYDVAKCNTCGTTLLVSEMFVLKRPPTSTVKLKEIFWCVECYDVSELKKTNNKNILPPVKN
jgi:hypothetical protein